MCSERWGCGRGCGNSQTIQPALRVLDCRTKPKDGAS